MKGLDVNYTGYASAIDIGMGYTPPRHRDDPAAPALGGISPPLRGDDASLAADALERSVPPRHPSRTICDRSVTAPPLYVVTEPPPVGA